MKLLVDQNLPPKLASNLAELYPGSCHVIEIGLDSVDDAVIWQMARDKQFVIVSKDSDFQHRALVYGAPPKVLLLSLGNCSTQEVIKFVTDRLNHIELFANDPDASLLVLE